MIYENAVLSRLTTGGNQNGSTKEKNFSLEKDEETFQRLEARNSYQPR